MSTWLSKAANVFKREVPEAPQPFELVCDCGQRHAGLRRQVFQHLVCKSCGTSLFVLPRDVYPAPPREERKASSTPAERTEKEIPGGPVMDASRPATGPTRKRRPAEISDPSSEATPASKPNPASQPRSALPQKPPSRTVAKSSSGIERIPPRRFLNPFRVVALLVVGIIVLTTWWMVRQSLLARAVRVAQQEGESGLEAVKHKEWLQARNHLELATAALDRLGRTDPEAETERQYYRELRAMLRPCTIPLGELIEKAQENYESQNEKKRSPRNLTPSYRGEWLIIEGLVRALPREEANGKTDACALTLPWSPDGSANGVVVRADFPVFSKVLSPGESKILIFAGAIDECSWNPDQQTWVVSLDSRSGFLWVNPETYLAAGFEFTPLRPEAKVLAELKQQGRQMGVVP